MSHSDANIPLVEIISEPYTSTNPPQYARQDSQQLSATSTASGERSHTTLDNQSQNTTDQSNLTNAPRHIRQLERSLSEATTVVNVGAGQSHIDLPRFTARTTGQSCCQAHSDDISKCVCYTVTFACGAGLVFGGIAAASACCNGCPPF
ncbi:hypothetical protein I204_01319 [Kwoniella mangroviensis CBS 8886]|uniref:uncharacterized protein n=1 Tax=Kwoniella mangroviensis CBS 8507 TaxID=1296122 RepID=UPI00080D66BC|nr:uncharacterized protein I203_06114 [Kwoniella mangroviensis CBS 8507]OCF64870.1 hypothetical protein I203_06114 [Kwoniella mangroviensis CBS 8507]OCF77331.1 hypothetical protein I204_01319 [Kwoniella mangroviensis CBS 8886]